MKKKYILIFVPLILMALLIITACETYKQQVVPLKLPSAYSNVAQAGDAQVAAQAYTDEAEAKEAFGFNIRKAGLLPVRVVIDNKGFHPLEIVASQTFLVDSAANLWPILGQQMAYDRLAKSTEWGKVVPEGAKTALLGAAAGAIIGAAIGIVTGHNVGQVIGKGAAVGAAAGAVVGGTRALTDREANLQIKQDLERQSLKHKAVPPAEVAYGFIFFPGEAKDARELRLMIRDIVTGKTYRVNLRL
jgi:hypothetical protein